MGISGSKDGRPNPRPGAPTTVAPKTHVSPELVHFAVAASPSTRRLISNPVSEDIRLHKQHDQADPQISRPLIHSQAEILFNPNEVNVQRLQGEKERLEEEHGKLEKEHGILKKEHKQLQDDFFSQFEQPSQRVAEEKAEQQQPPSPSVTAPSITLSKPPPSHFEPNHNLSVTPDIAVRLRKRSSSTRSPRTQSPSTSSKTLGRLGTLRKSVEEAVIDVSRKHQPGYPQAKSSVPLRSLQAASDDNESAAHSIKKPKTYQALAIIFMIVGFLQM